jgi:hypothetical protein
MLAREWGQRNEEILMEPDSKHSFANPALIRPQMPS